MDTNLAILYDPHTRESLAEINLLGQPVETGRLVPGFGWLQRFVVLSDTGGLRKFWLEKEMIVVQQAQSHQYARLVTFPESQKKQALLRLKTSL